MAKKVIAPPVVDVPAAKKQRSGLAMVFDHLRELVGEVEDLRVLEEGEVVKYRVNDKKAMTEGVLLGAIVEINKVLGK